MNDQMADKIRAVLGLREGEGAAGLYWCGYATGMLARRTRLLPDNANDVVLSMIQAGFSVETVVKLAEDDAMYTLVGMYGGDTGRIIATVTNASAWSWNE